MTNQDILNAFTAAHESDLHTSAFVMIGLPKETRSDVLATIDLLAAIRPGRFRWSIFFPYPGTVAYEIAKDGGLIDFEKMETLSNFTAESCLDFGAEHNLLIDKLAVAFPWFVNERTDLPSSPIYHELVSEIERMDTKTWERVRSSIRSTDRELSAFLTKSDREHYAIKYNEFMGVRSDWAD